LNSKNPESAASATDLPKQTVGITSTPRSGHTNYSTDFRQNGIKVVANQGGYGFPSSKFIDDKGKNEYPRVFDAAIYITV
jgi:hypothetical protein